jgi:hypothetical protein
MRIRSVLRVWPCLALLLLAPAVVSAQTTNVPNRITQVVDETRLTVLPGNTHPFARPEFDRGAAPASLPTRRMQLVLQRSPVQETALEALMAGQQDKSSASYHQWLTPLQFGQQFGPSDQDIQRVTSWLGSHGFQIAGVSSGRTVIEFSGTAGEIQEAFHTAIHRYVVNGQEHWANASDPQIPTALIPVVAGVATLHNFPRQPMHLLGGAVTRSKDTGKLRPVQPAQTLFTLGGQCGVPPGCFGVGPYDFATIYNVSPLWNATPTHIDGTGQTIAIVGESDININDVRDFRNYFGLPPNDPQFIVDGTDPGTVPGDETESDLDVEWSGAVAKGATIDFVISQTTEVSLGVDLSAQYIVNNNLAPVLSESYGICEFFLGTTANQFYDQLWQQAAAQGITVLVASGDSGAATCDHNAGTQGAAQFGLSVSGFASTPYNVAVGGTDFNDLTNTAPFWAPTNSTPPGNPGLPASVSALGYIPETTWNNTCTNAVFGNLLGFSTNPETNCNNLQLEEAGFVAAVGGSGGKSACTTSDGQNESTCSGGYAKPPWQTGTGVPADGKRDIPDVSLFAAIGGPSGAFYLMCAADLVQPGASSCQPTDPNTEFIEIGGTSASAPSFAGIMGLVVQKTGSRQGNANYILYKLAAQADASCNSTTVALPPTQNACVFYDVTNGTIAMPCVTGSLNCTTSNGGDSVGVLSGYATTSGYDPATGLGTVNATNLANAWATASTALESTTTSLTLNSGNPVSITHGSSVSFAINVTPTAGGGPPTGNVSLIANTAPPNFPPQITQQGLQGFVLSNGSASGTTQALPGGSNYTVFAQYPGDGTFGGSSSTPPVTVNVTAEPSKTLPNLVTLDINGNVTSFSASSATYGSGFVLFRVDVGDAAASISPSTGISSNCSKGLSNCPTGTVTLTPSTALGVGSLALNSKGYAEAQSLATGPYSFSVSYSGDNSYQSSPIPQQVNFTIAQAPTTISAAPDTSSIQYGNNTQIGATILTASDGIAPTGTVAFFLDGSPLPITAASYEGFPYEPGNSPPSFATLSATGLAIFPSLGSHSLTAQYSGDANYALANTTSGTVVTVTQAQPFFLTYGASPSSTNVNQQVMLTATLGGSDAGVPPTGTMTFLDGGAAVSGTVTYTPIPATPLTVSELQATMPYTPTTAGTHNITVSYSGDPNYLPATTPVAATLIVNGPTFTISANPTTVTVNAPGQSGPTTLTFTAENGFSSNGAVTVNPVCTGMPAESSCSSGAMITIATNGTATATLTFNTTAPSSAIPASRNRPNIPGWRTATASALAIMCLLCVGMLALGYRGKQRRWGVALVFTMFVLLAVSAGCGGGGGGSEPPPNSGTPEGQFHPVVTITINGVTQTVPNLVLQVN